MFILLIAQQTGLHKVRMVMVDVQLFFHGAKIDATFKLPKNPFTLLLEFSGILFLDFKNQL